MPTLVSKFAVHNHRTKPHVVAVEPWAHDFTLLPGESLEIFAMNEGVAPGFELVEWDNTSQVYCNDTDDFKVMQGDIQLKCGHQRMPKG